MSSQRSKAKKTEERRKWTQPTTYLSQPSWRKIHLAAGQAKACTSGWSMSWITMDMMMVITSLEVMKMIHFWRIWTQKRNLIQSILLKNKSFTGLASKRKMTMSSLKSSLITNKDTRISITSFIKSNSRLPLSKSTKIMRPHLSYHQLPDISMVTKASYSMTTLNNQRMKMEKTLEHQMGYTMFTVKDITHMEILTISSIRTTMVS